MAVSNILITSLFCVHPSAKPAFSGAELATLVEEGMEGLLVLMKSNFCSQSQDFSLCDTYALVELGYFEVPGWNIWDITLQN